MTNEDGVSLKIAKMIEDIKRRKYEIEELEFIIKRLEHGTNKKESNNNDFLNKETQKE